MPWSSFARMSESDLRALYRYLRSVPPARMPEESRHGHAQREPTAGR
jgi:hypothetical protein